MNNLFVILGLVTGAGLAVQALVNNRLRMALGGEAAWAGVVQTVVGLVALIVIGIAMRVPMPVTAGLSRYPWWIWVGGILGVNYVVVSIVLAPRLGTALMVASIVSGQLVTALVLDHYGWLGAAVVRLSPARLTGAVLLVAGILLMRWR